MLGHDPGIRDRLTSPVVARAGRDATNLNSRCRNYKNRPRTRSNSAAARSSNRGHHCHPTRSTSMHTFAKLALAAGACALGLGAVLPA